MYFTIETPYQLHCAAKRRHWIQTNGGNCQFLTNFETAFISDLAIIIIKAPTTPHMCRYTTL